MRGDAFDLQDMIEFLVIEVEDNLPKRSKKSGVQRQLADFVADLVGEFVEVVEIVEQPQHLHHTSSQALSDHVHHRRMLAAAQYPFPNPKDVGDYEDQNKENILAWVKRSELRLLPGDHGFARWRTAKIVFRQSVRKFLKTEEIEEVGSSSAEVTEFLNNKFPLVVL
ncbi:hypothetical protein B0T21DRAFT_441717 [Apiosordaria backusii]|uniref:Uncharacterized protein n=1 Tax=Apiosordaria backusii TaxID=314023 RepID=A0AA40BJH8_9PEZI|nr:hypothetical protein B0T21DRAFT_441717 [Apiosordaria backusii]